MSHQASQFTHSEFTLPLFFPEQVKYTKQLLTTYAHSFARKSI